MSCDDVTRELAQGGRELSPQAREHIRNCHECSLLMQAISSAAVAAPGPEPDPTVIDAIRTSLEPVKQIRPPGIYFLLFLTAVVALTGVAVYLKASVAGLNALGTGRAFDILGAVAIAVSTLAYLSTRLMVPGSRLRMSAGEGLAGSGLLILGAVLAVIPHTPHEHFARTALACFLLGLPFGLISALVVHLILRQGAPLSQRWAGVTASALGGLSGLAFLEIYCPLLDIWHVLAGHVGVPVFTGLVGLLAASLPGFGLPRAARR